MARFFGAADVGLAHDFEKGHAGAIEIDEARVAAQIVNIFARVFFHVDAGQADLL